MNLERSTSRFREIATSSAKVGVATAASLLGWVVGGKILALELGAAGVGVFGLLRQLLQNLNVFSTFNGSNALVQGLASRNGESRARYAHTVGRFYGTGATVVALVLVIGAPWLGQRLIPHPQATSLLRWLALGVIAVNAQGYFIGLLNGNRALDALVRSQILGPVAVLLIAYPVAKLVRNGHPAGLVLMLAVPGAIVALAAMVRARRAGWFEPLKRSFDRGDAASFVRMSAVLVCSGLLTTGTQYLQNRLVAEYLGLGQAGLFWVAWTLSMTYVTVLLGSYGTYYMPALSGLTDPAARHALIRDYLRLALLAMPVLVSFVILFKPWVVLLMFSAKLLPALNVMRWMLIGDFFKGIAWVLAFPMLAFSEMRWFFWTETAFNVALAGSAWAWLASGGGVEHLGTLFLVMYATYLVGMVGYIRLKHAFRLQRAEVLRFSWGLGVVAAMSWLTWRDWSVRPAAMVAFIVVIGTFIATAGVRTRWFFGSGAKHALRR